jgi:hypothetical protein
MWGWNEIRLRDGDNGNIRLSKKELAPTVRLSAFTEKILREDLAAPSTLCQYPSREPNTSCSIISGPTGILARALGDSFTYSAAICRRPVSRAGRGAPGWIGSVPV